MIGSSILYTPTISSFIIPRHLWECNNSYQANDCTKGALDVNGANGAGLTEDPTCTTTNPFGPTCVATVDYTSQGINVPSDFRVAATFDPTTSHALVGSGPYECKSIFNADLGQVGGGCLEDNTAPATTTGDCIAGAGCRSGQTTAAGYKAFLTAYDNTASSSDGFNQYMRGDNTAWGTGSGAAARSGQYEEFLHSDACNPTCAASYNPTPTGDGTIDITDLSYATKCGAAGGSPLPPAAFSSSASACSSWAQIVAKHLDDTAIGTNYSPWTSNKSTNGGLDNVEGYPVIGSQCPTSGLTDDPTICG